MKDGSGNSCFAQLPLMAVTGNRSCIGRQFALLELQTLVAAVVRKVSLSAAGPLDVIQVLHKLSFWQPTKGQGPTHEVA